VVDIERLEDSIYFFLRIFFAHHRGIAYDQLLGSQLSIVIKVEFLKGLKKLILFFFEIEERDDIQKNGFLKLIVGLVRWGLP
jgi:hypothetical protein